MTLLNEPILIIYALLSFILTALVILTKKYHNKYSNDVSTGVQKLHKKETPRIGGLGIVLTLILSSTFFKNEYSNLIMIIILLGSAVFLLGLIEDLLKKLSVFIRLTGSIIISFLGCIIFNIYISKLNIEYIDVLFSSYVFALIFTSIAVAGISHATNMIDGLNGLAGITLIIQFVGIYLISSVVNDNELNRVAIIYILTIFGFLVFNWPFGKIFLGDGGAYFCGTSIAWTAILLSERNMSVAPFSCLLICIYPFTETILSVSRRVYSGKKISDADAEHLHTLIYRKLNKKNSNNLYNYNSITGLILGLLNLIPIILAYIFYDKNYESFICCLIYISIYLYIYINFKYK